MTIPQDVMVDLATIGLTPEQARAVASMLARVEQATASESEEGKEKARARWRKWKESLGLTAAEWRSIRGTVLARDGHTCVYCGSIEEPLHVDHVIPLSRGGTNDEGNLVTACRECNCGKRDRTPDEWCA